MAGSRGALRFGAAGLALACTMTIAWMSWSTLFGDPPEVATETKPVASPGRPSKPHSADKKAIPAAPRSRSVGRAQDGNEVRLAADGTPDVERATFDRPVCVVVYADIYGGSNSLDIDEIRKGLFESLAAVSDAGFRPYLLVHEDTKVEHRFLALLNEFERELLNRRRSWESDRNAREDGTRKLGTSRKTAKEQRSSLATTRAKGKQSEAASESWEPSFSYETFRGGKDLTERLDRVKGRFFRTSFSQGRPASHGVIIFRGHCGETVGMQEEVFLCPDGTSCSIEAVASGFIRAGLHVVVINDGCAHNANPGGVFKPLMKKGADQRGNEVIADKTVEEFVQRALQSDLPVVAARDATRMHSAPENAPLRAEQSLFLCLPKSMKIVKSQDGRRRFLHHQKSWSEKELERIHAAPQPNLLSLHTLFDLLREGMEFHGAQPPRMFYGYTPQPMVVAATDANVPFVPPARPLLDRWGAVEGGPRQLLRYSDQRTTDRDHAFSAEFGREGGCVISRNKRDFNRDYLIVGRFADDVIEVMRGAVLSIEAIANADVTFDVQVLGTSRRRPDGEFTRPGEEGYESKHLHKWPDYRWPLSLRKDQRETLVLRLDEIADSMSIDSLIFGTTTTPDDARVGWPVGARLTVLSIEVAYPQQAQPKPPANSVLQRWWPSRSLALGRGAPVVVNREISKGRHILGIECCFERVGIDPKVRTGVCGPVFPKSAWSQGAGVTLRLEDVVVSAGDGDHVPTVSVIALAQGEKCHVVKEWKKSDKALNEKGELMINGQLPTDVDAIAIVTSNVVRYTVVGVELSAAR